MGPKPWRFKSDGKAQRKVLEAGTGMCDWQGASMLEKKMRNNFETKFVG